MFKPKKDLISNKFPIVIAIIIVLIAASAFTYYYCQNKSNKTLKLIDNKANMPFITNIIKETEQNSYFRKVLFTGARSQLVVMSIPPNGEVGEETHAYTEQTLFFLSGAGQAVLDRKESPIKAGDAVVVTPGIKHNFINTGSDPLKIYTIYAPPNHIDGRVHVTKDDADKDIQDEAYGQQAK